uniref:WGS project CAEQ00000000 data, annotated contig 1109 n=1 Tax=Trypanosoma congolense (strain IL3000) TaxID=1068625 RepID=F9W3U2_TRYCI|nr:unnamed protein product [Trypanosoma congolense IL3000]
MNENAKVQRLVDELGCLISEWTVNGVSERVAQQFSDLYRRFMLTVHHDLGSSIDKGPALATAACIPLWEMLHFYSGAFAPLQASSKALVIILLTSLYPKARDRRCLYQHLGCVGSLGFSSVPLNWNVPTKTEVIEDLTSDGSEQDGYSEIVNYVQNTLLVEEEILKTCSTVGLGSKVKTLMEDVLPRCYLVDQDSNVSETGMPSESAIVITRR